MCHHSTLEIHRVQFIGSDSCVCLRHQHLSLPLPPSPLLPFRASLPFPGSLSLPIPSSPFLPPSSRRRRGAQSPVWGPGCYSRKIFRIVVSGLVHSGALWQQIGGSAQVCSFLIRHSSSSDLGQHFEWVAAPTSAMGCP